MGAVGRPSKYKPEYCTAILVHMRQGLSKESFAALVDVDRDTIKEWAKVHPEFSAAVKRGEALSLLFWEREGIAGMWEGKIFNAAVWFINMKNRFGWADKPQEGVGSGSKTVQLAYLPKSQRKPEGVE